MTLDWNLPKKYFPDRKRYFSNQYSNSQREEIISDRLAQMADELERLLKREFTLDELHAFYELKILDDHQSRPKNTLIKLTRFLPAIGQLYSCSLDLPQYLHSGLYADLIRLAVNVDINKQNCVIIFKDLVSQISDNRLLTMMQSYQYLGTILSFFLSPIWTDYHYWYFINLADSISPTNYGKYGIENTFHDIVRKIRVEKDEVKYYYYFGFDENYEPILRKELIQ